MRGIVKYKRSLNLLHHSCLTHNTKYQHFPFQYIACAASFSSLTPRSTKTIEPFTEKVRKKIWGTDQPPGQANPYEKNTYLQSTYQTLEGSTSSETQIQDISINEGISQYEPATTWDGLEQVGGLEHLLVKEWLPGNTFDASFVPKNTMSNVDEITATVRRVLVEIFAWQQANRQLVDFSMAPKPSADFTMNVNMSYSQKMGIKLHYPDNTTMENIIRTLIPEKIEKNASTSHESDSIPIETNNNPLISAEVAGQDGTKEAEQSAVEKLSTTGPISPEEVTIESTSHSEETKIQPINYQELITSWDSSWMNIPITDSEIKFALFKRILQLSGIRISDAIITSTTTAGVLLKQIIKPPKNRKLAELLVEKKELSILPNVFIHPRRITLRDKETKVGRWKLIEEEFIARGLVSDKRGSVNTFHG